MEKRTILAVALSMVVMLGFFFVQEKFFPRNTNTTPQRTSDSSGVQETAETVSVASEGAASVFSQEAQTQETRFPDSVEDIPLQTVTIETDLIRVVLTNAGGNVVSFQLKNHLDHGAPVEMIFTGDLESQAFAVAFGNMEDVIARRVMSEKRNFRVRWISDYIVEFSREFVVSPGSSFTMIKRYEFKPGEYMFELNIAMDGGHSLGSFNFRGAAYTLMFGPQIGPRFAKLDQRYEFRRYLTYRGKMKTERVNDKDPTFINTQPSWAAIAGKYFTFVALPYASQYDLAFAASKTESGIPNTSRLFISRPASSSSRIEDKYHFYLGPKNLQSLNIYERGDNGFRLRETGLIEVASSKGFLSPVENVLKWFLMIFHKMIPNYGIAIILVTILVKIVMFPLTKKSSESTMRMQALAPKIKEIQTKYKDNPQKMNAEMSEFYKKEGYNPISGCLPMFLQFPIFIAMYNLFNNHFDLRGAMFIPGWIPDLSVPESVYTFPNDFQLPLLGWTAIRILPFIYVGSQLLYGKVTQNPGQQGNSQMKMMLYVMPVVFFFILYDVPSGLLLYWVMSNLLMMVQQVGINKYLARKKAAAGGGNEAPPVIAIPKKRKKK